MLSIYARVSPMAKMIPGRLLYSAPPSFGITSAPMPLPPGCYAYGCFFDCIVMHHRRQRRFASPFHATIAKLYLVLMFARDIGASPMTTSRRTPVFELCRLQWDFHIVLAALMQRLFCRYIYVLRLFSYHYFREADMQRVDISDRAPAFIASVSTEISRGMQFHGDEDRQPPISPCRRHQKLGDNKKSRGHFGRIYFR